MCSCFAAGAGQRTYLRPGSCAAGASVRSLSGRQNGLTQRDRTAIYDARLLLVIQIAICAVLVTSSLVAVRGLVRSLHSNFGFQPQSAMLVETDLDMGGYSGDRVAQCSGACSMRQRRFRE
jgi:hypothetical protein